MLQLFTCVFLHENVQGMGKHLEYTLSYLQYMWHMTYVTCYENVAIFHTCVFAWKCLGYEQTSWIHAVLSTVHVTHDIRGVLRQCCNFSHMCIAWKCLGYEQTYWIHAVLSTVHVTHDIRGVGMKMLHFFNICVFAWKCLRHQQTSQYTLSYLQYRGHMTYVAWVWKCCIFLTCVYLHENVYGKSKHLEYTLSYLLYMWHMTYVA